MPKRRGGPSARPAACLAIATAPTGGRTPRARGSERRDLLRDGGLAVGGLVLVDDALRGGLVQLLHRDGEGRGGLVLVTGADREAHVAHVGAQLALHGLVAVVRLLVRPDALQLRLDVRQCRFRSLPVGRRDAPNRFAPRQAEQEPGRPRSTRERRKTNRKR